MLVRLKFSTRRIERATALVVLSICICVSLASCTGSNKNTSKAPTTTHGAAGATTTTYDAGKITSKVRAVTIKREPYVLANPVSRPAVAVNGQAIVVLGGLTTGDVSTSKVSILETDKGVVGAARPLGLAVHDAAATSNGSNGAWVFAGGGAHIVSDVQAWSETGTTKIGNLPSPRADLVAARIGNTTYVLGGSDGTETTKDILSTQDGISFAKVGTLVVGVRYPGCVAVGTDIYLFGGETQAAEGAKVLRTNVVQKFDTKTGQTMQVGTLPQAMSHVGVGALQGSVFLIGGRTNEGPSNSVKQVTMDTDGLRTVDAGTLPTFVSDSGIANVNDAIYVIGGEVNSPKEPLNSVFRISAS